MSPAVSAKESRRIYPSADETSHAFVEALVQAAAKRTAQGALFSLALSGGNTPRTLLEMLGSPPYVERFPWDHTLFIWGDERCVPPDDPLSNYGMAMEALLSRRSIPKAHILRMRGEGQPEDEALRYEALLRSKLQAVDPVIDWVWLGLGPDGHTASLFPPLPQSDQAGDRLVLVSDGPRGGPNSVRRITLSYRTLAAARHLAVLAMGEGKAPIIGSLLERPMESPHRYPMDRVRSESRSIAWWLDEAAAEMLHKRDP
ncbi:MAG: 6-phosphogluconolactonase [Magnetococcales bacterium]|nr:6-phosphogluconolactonase [Magnetococcales bacterium]